MNLRNTMPEIPDSWRGGIAAACRVLGNEGRPLSKTTLKEYCAKAVSQGGIAWTVGVNGRKVFKGSELKRWWAAHILGNPSITLKDLERARRGRLEI